MTDHTRDRDDLADALLALSRIRSLTRKTREELDNEYYAKPLRNYRAGTHVDAALEMLDGIIAHLIR